MSQEAFETLFTSEHARLVTLAVTITRDRALAEDMVQDSFAQLWRKRSSVELPLAWLRRTVTTNCLDAVRTRNRRLAILRRQAPPPPAQLDSDVELLSMLAGLNERQRAVICLTYLHGLRESEVAEALGCRPGTVKSTLHRARAILRTTLESEAL